MSKQKRNVNDAIFLSEIGAAMHAINASCRKFGVDFEPSIVLRHRETNARSCVISNDEPLVIIECLDYLQREPNPIEGEISVVPAQPEPRPAPRPSNN